VAVYRRSRRHRFVLVLLVLTSITVITLDFRDGGDGAVESLRTAGREAFAPVQDAVQGVLSPVGDFFGGITRYRSVRAENARLRAEVEQARTESVRAADAERERELLTRLANLDFAEDLRDIPARVVDNAPSNFERTVTLDRGAEAGVAVGMPVVTDAGLVGRVVEVSPTRSRVLLVTDRSSRVGVRLATSRDIGALAGAGPRGLLSLDLINVDTAVSEGEAVLTSGLDQGILPAQIPVGTVRSARVPDGALTQEVLVEPFVDFGRLELVRILVWTPRP
jgi:rod shape-determining protein MreC